MYVELQIGGVVTCLRPLPNPQNNKITKPEITATRLRSSFIVLYMYLSYLLLI